MVGKKQIDFQKIWLDKRVPKQERAPSISFPKFHWYYYFLCRGRLEPKFFVWKLSTNIVNKVVDKPDVMGWEGTNTHQFTVQSAYRLQHGDIHVMEGDWNSLWD